MTAEELNSLIKYAESTLDKLEEYEKSEEAYERIQDEIISRRDNRGQKSESTKKRVKAYNDAIYERICNGEPVRRVARLMDEEPANMLRRITNNGYDMSKVPRQWHRKPRNKHKKK